MKKQPPFRRRAPVRRVPRRERKDGRQAVPRVLVVVEGVGDKREAGEEGGVGREGLRESEGIGVARAVVGVGGGEAEEAVGGGGGGQADVRRGAGGGRVVGEGAHEPGVVGEVEVFKGEEGEGGGEKSRGVEGLELEEEEWGEENGEEEEKGAFGEDGLLLLLLLL